MTQPTENAGALPLEDEYPEPLADVSPEGDEAEEQTEAKKPVPQPKYEIPKATEGGVPEWFGKLPPELKFPRGRQAIFLRFRATLTDTPWKGERQVVLWPISVGDKKLAIQRSQGDANRFADEIAKQMIRAIDGHMVDWTGNPGPGNVDVFWEDVGERGRTMLQRMFTQLHIPTRDEMVDFFENCIAVRSTG